MGHFKKAERKRAKLRLGLMGSAGSGKTFSALKIAMGMGGKIALIDTENGSGELYSHLTDYDIAPISPPYDPRKYIELMGEAEKAGYDTIIIDSLSHAWSGSGGVLDIKDAATKASKSGNEYTAGWRTATPIHNSLVDAILQSKCHVITTLRSKQEYILVDSGNGKKSPKKIGMAPIQREGMEYEFTLVLDIDQESHYATATKDRTGLYDGKVPGVLSEADGKTILDWLESGAEPPQPSLLEEKKEAVRGQMKLMKMKGSTLIDILSDLLQKKTIDTEEEAEQVLSYLQDMASKKTDGGTPQEEIDKTMAGLEA